MASAKRIYKKTDLYLGDIPAMNIYNVCQFLDNLNLWPDLASRMGYDEKSINAIQSNETGSPSESLLIQRWGQNHTVTELFMLLNSMKLYRAMDLIKNFVDIKYHSLLKNTNTSKECPEKINILQEQQKSPSEEQNLIKSFILEELSISNNEISCKNSQKQIINLENIDEYAEGLPKAKYSEISKATKNWNDDMLLGRGGYGFVFKAYWKSTLVAVKIFKFRKEPSSVQEKNYQMQQYLNELKFMNMCRHDNILPIYGYSIKGKELCLILQLMNGSLDKRLKSEQNPLKWNQRLNIAFGIFRGINYLHTVREMPIIHGDIKPANILLDINDQPKIGDFGLARNGPRLINAPMDVSHIYGTKPYLPKEVLCYSTIYTKVDTFSYGVVLLEMVTGLKPYDPQRERKFLSKFIREQFSNNVSVLELITQNISMEGIDEIIAKTILKLGVDCVADTPECRPENVEILNRFQRIMVENC